MFLRSVLSIVVWNNVFFFFSSGKRDTAQESIKRTFVHNARPDKSVAFSLRTSSLFLREGIPPSFFFQVFFTPPICLGTERPGLHLLPSAGTRSYHRAMVGCAWLCGCVFCRRAGGGLGPGQQQEFSGGGGINTDYPRCKTLFFFSFSHATGGQFGRNEGKKKIPRNTPMLTKHWVIGNAGEKNKKRKRFAPFPSPESFNTTLPAYLLMYLVSFSFSSSSRLTCPFWFDSIANHSSPIQPCHVSHCRTTRRCTAAHHPFSPSIPTGGQSRSEPGAMGRDWELGFPAWKKKKKKKLPYLPTDPASLLTCSIPCTKTKVPLLPCLPCPL